MKKILAFFIPIFILALASCSKDGDSLLTEDGNSPILLSVSLDETRASHNLDTQLAEGEGVRIWVEKTADDYEYENILHTVSEGGKLQLADGEDAMIYPLGVETINIYALHSLSSLDTSDELFDEKTHTVALNQTSSVTAAGAGYQGSDLTFGKLENMPQTPSYLRVQMQHLLSKVELVLYNKRPDNATVTVKSVKILNTKPTARYTLAKDLNHTIAAEGTAGTIEIDADESADAETKVLNEAIVVPQEIAANTNLFEITLSNEEVLHLSLDEVYTFLSSKKHRFELTLYAHDIELSATQVEDWIDGDTHEGDLGIEESDVQFIYTVDELMAINDGEESRKGRYRLMNDLNLGGSTKPWTPIGKLDTEFTGTFDGGGHSISGLYINYSSDDNSGYLGLFGYAEDATIENIRIINPQIQAGGSVKHWVGAIVGAAERTTIKNCEVLGDEDALDAYIKLLNEGNVGAIAGYSYASHIIGCHNSCALTGGGSNNWVGGIVGVSYFSSIVACSNSATIEITQSNSDVGGIAGYVESSEIHGCFSVGQIEKPEGSSSAGAIAGSNYFYGTIEGCYYLSNDTTNNGMQGVGETKPDSTSTTTPVDNLAALNKDATGEPIAAMNAAIHSFATDADNSDAAWIYDSVNGKLLFGFKVNGAAGDEAAPLITENLTYPAN